MLRISDEDNPSDARTTSSDEVDLNSLQEMFVRQAGHEGVSKNHDESKPPMPTSNSSTFTQGTGDVLREGYDLREVAEASDPANLECNSSDDVMTMFAEAISALNRIIKPSRSRSRSSSVFTEC